MGNTAIHLTMTKRLLARADEAAEAEGLTRPEYVRRCIVAGCERTEALQARRSRQGKASMERRRAKAARG